MAQEEKPFYIRQLPKEAQDWLRDKAYKSFIADGDKEEDAQKKAEDFLDEKVYTAEEIYGKDFLNEVGKIEEPKKEVEVKEEVKIPPAYKGHLEEDNPPKTDITEEDVERFGKDALKGLSGKKPLEEDDELDAYTKDLEDYLEKNPKAKDKNYY